MFQKFSNQVLLSIFARISKKDIDGNAHKDSIKTVKNVKDAINKYFYFGKKIKT